MNLLSSFTLSPCHLAAASSEPWLQFLGRLHPLVLHGPIGLLIGLLALELFGLVRRRPLPADFRAALCWLCTIAAIISVASGLALSQEDQSATQTLQLHQWLGISVAVACLIATLLQQRRRYLGYAFTLLVTLGLLIPAGHFGASMTHGANFLTEPFAQRTPASPRAATSNVSAPAVTDHFTSVILPILQNRCTSCHNVERRKGGLELHSLEAVLKGGKHGEVVIPGNPDESELLVRLQLPLDDLDHMPPPEKPQPTADEIRAIHDWIQSSAGVTANAPAPPPIAAAKPPARPVGPVAASPAALAALRAELIHAEPVSQDSPLLVIDFTAAASATNDESLARLLTPIKDNIADLALARTRITDASAPLIAQFPNLHRLNLTSTALTDAGLVSLTRHPKLEDLTLARTQVSDSAAETLASLPNLKRLYLWDSKITADGLAALRGKRPDLVIDSGAPRPDPVVEAEAPIKFTSDAPVPGSTPAPSAEALRPSNATCPVTGAAINPDYAIVYKGRVIAFCCNKCAAQFWEDPAKYADKLK